MNRVRVLTASGGPALLLIAAVLPEFRPMAAVALAAVWISLRSSDHPAALAWAAALPVAVTLAWPWFLGTDHPLGEAACATAFSEIAVRRLAVAALGLLVIGGIVRAHGVTIAELGLRRPGRLEAAVAIAGLVVLALGGLVIGPLVAAPFFGQLVFATPLGAIVPALLFGIANGMLEELAYRGVLQGLLGRIGPAWAVIAFQGVIFGIVHVGPEVIALAPVHVALLSVVGIAGGVARWRFGSAWIPIGVHIGADIALYVGLACRAAA